MDDKFRIAIKIAGFAVVSGLVLLVAVCAYKHRVVETKSFSVTATIDTHDYRPPYTTYTTYHNNSGIHRVPHFHPARYYLHYTVDFEGEAYTDNQENVGVEYYNQHKDGDKVDAVFEKQWRADGSETYRIYLIIGTD